MKKYRLLRVVLHFLLINGLFFLTYKLRLIGDFLPWIHLPIPFINADELCLFSLIASASFVSIWVIKSFYPLNKKIINHFQTLNKVWLYWFISIAFLSYFWQGFIFFFWISRFIILVTAVLSRVVILLFDQLRKAFEFRWQKKSLKTDSCDCTRGARIRGTPCNNQREFRASSQGNRTWKSWWGWLPKIWNLYYHLNVPKRDSTSDFWKNENEWNQIFSH